MKKLFFIMGIVSTIICFLWAGYVLYMQGTVNSGPAVISMVAALCCSLAYRSMIDKEKKRIIAAGIKTPGKIVDVKKCWWIKVNTKPIRKNSLDGAVFPHIIHFAYTVNGTVYKGKKFMGYSSVLYSIDSLIDVYYDSNKPKLHAIK